MTMNNMRAESDKCRYGGDDKNGQTTQDASFGPSSVDSVRVFFFSFTFYYF